MFVAQRGICLLVHIEFCVTTLHLGTLSVCLAWSSHLSRYCRCVHCLCCDRDMWSFYLSYLKLETEDGVYRIIGSGATVQSVSRCLLVVKRAISLFHNGMKKLQRWNHLSSESNSLCLKRRRKSDTCVVLVFSPRSTQKVTHFDESETT